MLLVLPESCFSVALRDVQVLEVHVSADVPILETYYFHASCIDIAGSSARASRICLASCFTSNSSWSLCRWMSWGLKLKGLPSAASHRPSSGSTVSSSRHLSRKVPSASRSRTRSGCSIAQSSFTLIVYNNISAMLLPASFRFFFIFVAEWWCHVLLASCSLSVLPSAGQHKHMRGNSW